MHRLLLFIFLLAAPFVRSQEDDGYDTAPLPVVWKMAIDGDCTWDVDYAGNVYLFHQQTVAKLDSTGKQLLTQSVKSLGTVTKIDASNWLKIALFSEEQQQVCYLDNALALQPTKIDLAELGVTLAQQFSTSAQTDRIWVFDQLNSELQLITIRTNQRQIVQNLKSLADIGNVLQMLEFDNTLYILSDNGTVALFDNFGTYISGYEISSSCIQPFAKGILSARGNSIYFTDAENQEDIPLFILDVEGEKITHFLLAGKRLYVSTDKMFYCYRAD